MTFSASKGRLSGVIPRDDPDNDSLVNFREFQLGTNPFEKDTDGDGFDDDYEYQEGTDPTDPLDYPILTFFTSTYVKTSNTAKMISVSWT